MPLLNLSLVTQAFVALLDNAVRNSPEWDPLNTLTVSPFPPDRLTGNHTIGFYLYHAMEEPAYKNPPPSTDGPAPDRYQPMGLSLHYLLTAHSDFETPAAAYAEQLMMGLAMKALRDHPVIDDDTTVAGVTLFSSAITGRRNRFRITLEPPDAREAVQYWTAGSQPLRLAAYYQVSPVLLEPDSAPSRAGRVITLGAHTFVRGRPRLEGSRSTTVFTLPTETTPREVESRPAEVPVGRQVIFFGSELSGEATSLLIQYVRWEEPIEVDPMEWGVTAAGDRLFATVRQHAGSERILPGIYMAAAKVRTRRQMPDGSFRNFDSTSNQTAFAITPRVDGVVFDAGLGTATGNGFDPSLTEEQVQVYAGATRLERVAAAPSPGQFRTVDASTIEFRLPGDVVQGSQVPFRVLVRGAESPPFWVTAP